MKRYLPWQRIKNRFHQRAREAQPSLRRYLSASGGHQINDQWRRLGNACFLKDRQRRFMNPFKITVGKQPYPTADSRELRRRCIGWRRLGAAAAPLTRTAATASPRTVTSRTG